MCKGTGDANRTVEALGIELPEERADFEPGDDAIGTGTGREDGELSLGVDMVILSLV